MLALIHARTRRHTNIHRRTQSMLAESDVGTSNLSSTKEPKKITLYK